jgi:probable rRNA maturation factor
MGGPASNKRRTDAPLSVEIVLRGGDWRAAGIDQDLLERAARHAFSLASGGESTGAEVAVALCDDAEVRQLNATWRDTDKPTNVLSFPAADDIPANNDMRTLGDVVLAFETVAGEAQTAGLELNHHAAHLVVHGVLHLVGYDHETDEDARQMEELERRILSGLNIADPYAVAAVAESA